MLRLPNEILETIVKDLSYPCLVSLSNTCKELYEALKFYRAEKKKYISWKIVVHIIKDNHEIIIDKSWVTLGTSKSYHDYTTNQWEWCSDCEEMDYSNSYIKHGSFYTKQYNIITAISKGIGGEMVDNIFKHCYTDNGVKYIPLSIDFNGIDELIYDFDIGIHKSGKSCNAKLCVNNLDSFVYTTDEIQNYFVTGLYLDPNQYNLNSPYYDLSSEDLGDYDYEQYNRSEDNIY